MKVVISFHQDGRILHRHEATINAEGDLSAAIGAAIEDFRRRYPGISLFDDVTLKIDKAD